MSWYLMDTTYAPADEDFPPCFVCEHPMLKMLGPWIERHECPACEAKTVTPYGCPAVVVFNVTTGKIEQP